MKDRLVECIIRHSVAPELEGRWAVQVSPDGERIGICWLPNAKEGQDADAQGQFEGWQVFPLPVLSRQDMQGDVEDFAEDAAWFSAEMALDQWIWEIQRNGLVPQALYFL